MASLAELQQRIETVRRKERMVIWMTGISKSIMAAVAIVLAYFLIDWIFELPYMVRLFCVALCLGVEFYVIRKHLVFELRKIRDDDEIALRIESRNPELRGRLISTLQLNREDRRGSFVGSVDLLNALEGETLQMAGPLDFSRIINVSVLKKFALAAFLAVLLKVGLLLLFAGHFQALFGRILSPDARFPTRTVIEEIILPETVARGDDILIKVVLSPKSEAVSTPGTAQCAGVGGARVSVELNNKIDPNIFIGTLSKATENMTIMAKVGDTVSVAKTIRVLARPEVDAVNSSLQYTLPAYTKEALPPAEKFGGISVLQGSIAEMTLTASKSLVSAVLQRNDGKNFELKKVSDNGLAWKLPAMLVEKSGSFHLALMDTDQLSNAQPGVEYSIDARIDHPPVVKLNKPSRDVTVTGLQKLKISFSARDDYNVRAVWVAYKIQSEGATAIASVKRQELPFKNEKVMEREFTWDLSALNLKIGDQLIVWIEAADDCTTNREPPVVARSKAGESDPAALKVAEEKLFAFTNDVKLSVISREDKIAEWETELQRIVQGVDNIKTDEVNIIRETIKELEKGGGK